MTPTNKQFEAIARQHLSIETLEARNHDSLDFHTVSVWEVRKALDAAYEAGRAVTTTRPNPKGHDESELFAHVREQLSPEAVAAIAAWLQPVQTNNADVNRQVAWFRDRLVEMLGTDQYNALCNELGL